MFARKEISVTSRKLIPFSSKCSNPTAECVDSVKASGKADKVRVLKKLSTYLGPNSISGNAVAFTVFFCEPRSGYYNKIILC